MKQHTYRESVLFIGTQFSILYTHLHDETAHVYTMTLLHLSADDETVTHDL